MDYIVPSSGELIPLTVRATLDGSATVAEWFGVVQVIAPSGRIMLNAITTAIAAGASADVSWFPRVAAAAASSSGGVGPAVIYEKTLTGTTALFDTGVGGVPQTYKDLLILTTLRTSEAIEGTFDCQLNINGDFAGTYKDYRIKALGAALTVQADSPGGWMGMSAAGAASDANQFAAGAMYIPNYTRSGDQTALSLQGVIPKVGSTTNWNLGIGMHTYVVSDPISRIEVSPNVGGGGQFVAGSRCIIYGLG